MSTLLFAKSKRTGTVIDRDAGSRTSPGTVVSIAPASGFVVVLIVIDPPAVFAANALARDRTISEACSCLAPMPQPDAITITVAATPAATNHRRLPTTHHPP